MFETLPDDVPAIEFLTKFTAERAVPGAFVVLPNGGKGGETLIQFFSNPERAGNLTQNFLVNVLSPSGDCEVVALNNLPPGFEVTFTLKTPGGQEYRSLFSGNAGNQPQAPVRLED